MKCEYCGAEIAEGSIFCNYCGRPVGEIEDTEDIEEESLLFSIAQEREKKNGAQGGGTARARAGMSPAMRLGLILIGIAAVVVCVVVFVIFRLRQEPKLTEEEAYQQELQMLEEAISGKNYGEAEEHLTRASEYAAADSYLLLQRELEIDKGLSDASGVTDTLEKLVRIAHEDGMISDERDFYADLFAAYEGAYGERDAARLKELVAVLHSAEDEALQEIVAPYQPDAPVFTLPQGEIRPGDVVSVDAAEGCELVYSDSADAPVRGKETGASHVEIPLEAGENEIWMFCVRTDEYAGLESEVRVFSYYLDTVYAVPMPEVYPDSGEYTEHFLIHVEVPEGYRAYYAWNDTPTVSSSPYTEDVEVIEGNNVFAVIYEDAYGNVSNVQRVNYIYLPADEPEEDQMPEEDQQPEEAGEPETEAEGV